MLFKIASETEQTASLDRLCRKRAARGLRRIAQDQLLFVNVETSSVFDPTLATDGPLADRNTQVVFEITERAAISDFATFRQSGQSLKRSGFKLAVDDVGAGYAGLRVITEVDADYIKLDMSLTRDVHKSQVKLQLIRAIAGFCVDAGVSLIVEGVESADELTALTSLGVHLMQGYLFSHPVERPGAEQIVFPEASFPA
jgi:EAL domain-containing protein (putative c-di-GMP-specific phosphodiesterase class I)